MEIRPHLCGLVPIPIAMGTLSAAVSSEFNWGISIGQSFPCLISFPLKTKNYKTAGKMNIEGQVSEFVPLLSFEMFYCGRWRKLANLIYIPCKGLQHHKRHHLLYFYFLKS